MEDGRFEAQATIRQSSRIFKAAQESILNHPRRDHPIAHFSAQVSAWLGRRIALRPILVHWCSGLMNPIFSVRLNGFIKLWLPIRELRTVHRCTALPFSSSGDRPGWWDLNPCGHNAIVGRLFQMSCLLYFLSIASGHKVTNRPDWKSGASQRGCIRDSMAVLVVWILII